MHIYLACNEISDIDNAFEGTLNTRFDLDLGGNRIDRLPVAIFDGHSFIQVDVRFNPLEKVSKDFCNNNCVIDAFYFECSVTSVEAGESIMKWAEGKQVRVLSRPCSYLKMNFVSVPWRGCNEGPSVRGYKGLVGVLLVVFFCT